MRVDRTEGRQAPQRAFRPTLGGLEPRLLLSGTPGSAKVLPGKVYLANPSLGFAYTKKNPTFLAHDAPPFDRTPISFTPKIAERTMHGGQEVKVNVSGAVFYVTLVPFTPGPAAQSTTGTVTTTPTVTGEPQVPGTVRVYPAGNGQVTIIVDGSNQFTELDIAPATVPQKKGYAHSFAYGLAGREKMLAVAGITINSGNIGGIDAYHSADLYGPITDNGAYTVDRIALNSIQPGGSIITGGDVNTLDVAQGITLSGPTGNITIGRDLNLLNVGQNLTLENGANFTINRDSGLVPQPAKGTGYGSNFLTLNQSSLSNTVNTIVYPNLAANIFGNMVINSGSAFKIGGMIGQSVFYVAGRVTGATRLSIPNGLYATALPTQSTPPPVPNFVALGGFAP